MVIIKMLRLRPPDSVPYVVGHRGARTSAPENTIRSFEKAAEARADLIELDVHFTEDRKLVVIHDATVDRTTDGFGLVRDLQLAQIRRLNAGDGEQIPTFDEVLSWAKPRDQLGLVVEIKEDLYIYPGISEAVLDTIREHNLSERTIVISFDYAVVHEIKDLSREIAAGVLFDYPITDPLAVVRETHADAMFPSIRLVNSELVQLLHANNIAVYTWNANDPLQAQTAIEAGVDGIGTDQPDLLHKLVQTRYGRNRGVAA